VSNDREPGEDDSNRLAFERDLAVRQAKISLTDLQVVRMALEENRPLEALRQVDDSIDRLEDELDGLDGVLDGGDAA